LLGRRGLQTRLLGDLERDVAEHTIKVGSSRPARLCGQRDQVARYGLRIPAADRTG